MRRQGTETALLLFALVLLTAVAGTIGWALALVSP
jgi:hypothetical protein